MAIDQTTRPGNWTKFTNVLMAGCIFLSLVFSQDRQDRPYVLVIAFDGFRADYLDWYATPNFDKLVRNGVKARGMKPVYVTKTFPNFYSLATGMYPETHGLIDNYYYDPLFDDFFTLSDRSKVEDARWYGGEPIWVTAERQGIKTASFFWVGSEAPVGGIRPSIWKRYDHQFPFEARIDSVMSWFQLPIDKRPQLSMLYFHEPDATSHQFGVRSPDTERLIAETDNLLGHILELIQDLDIYPYLNILVMSDHGMADISPDRVIDLSETVDLEGVKQIRTGPYSRMYGASSEKIEKVYLQLKKVPHMTVYMKTQIPDRLHYRDHYRIKDLLLIADEGWSILDYNNPRPERYTGATHGYDNDLASMRAIFVADGPAFKDGYERDVFENVNVYPLIAHILGIKPAPEIDGNLENVRDLLRE